jgi:hypothetical protein
MLSMRKMFQRREVFLCLYSEHRAVSSAERPHRSAAPIVASLSVPAVRYEKKASPTVAPGTALKIAVLGISYDASSAPSRVSDNSQCAFTKEQCQPDNNLLALLSIVVLASLIAGRYNPLCYPGCAFFGMGRRYIDISQLTEPHCSDRI